MFRTLAALGLLSALANAFTRQTAVKTTARMAFQVREKINFNMLDTRYDSLHHLKLHLRLGLAGLRARRVRQLRAFSARPREVLMQSFACVGHRSHCTCIGTG